MAEYITIFTKLGIQTYFGNSILLQSIHVYQRIGGAMSPMSARMEFKLKGLLPDVYHHSFYPSISISFPIYRLLSDLGLKDTRAGFFIYSGLRIAVTFSLSAVISPQFKKWRSARMTAAATALLFRIIVPIARPGLSTAAIMVFLNAE
ncbi:MAG: hypothetical protein ACLRXA_23030 [Clostridium sp.]